MTVLLPNDTVGVRRRVEGALTPHGERTRSGCGPMVGDPLPARVSERSDAGWNIGVETSMWPVRKGDLIVSATGRSWLVNTAQKITNNEFDDVDWVRLDCSQRSRGGTEPNDPWFVARYSDSVDPIPLDEATPFDQTAHLWTGYGPPPDDWEPMEGQEYIDLATGFVYRFGDED